MLRGPGYRNETGLVFTNADGSAIHPERFSSWFDVRIITEHGELIGECTIDPTRDYQPIK